MGILKDFLVNLPLLARIVAYIIGIIVWTWFIFLYPGLKRETTGKETKISVVLPAGEDKENQIKKTKIKIDKLIEDANRWIEEKIEQNKIETDKMENLFNKQSTLYSGYSGMHTVEQIKRVNHFIKSINDYIRDMNRQIENLLIERKEEKFESVEWLKEEYQKYLNFIAVSDKVKASIKKQNNEICIRFSDEATFNNVLKNNPYRE